MIDRRCREAGFEPHITYRINDCQMTQALVAAGEGIAVLPRLMLQAAHPGVAIRPLAADPPIRRVSALRLSSRYLTPATERFLALLVGASERYASPSVVGSARRATSTALRLRRGLRSLRLMTNQPDPEERQLESVYESMLAALARRDVGLLDSLLADDVEFRSYATGPEPMRGKSEVLEAVKATRDRSSTPSCSSFEHLGDGWLIAAAGCGTRQRAAGWPTAARPPSRGSSTRRCT